jgi:hypothetical protein
LPVKPAARGDTWQASQEAIREMTDLRQIQSGQLECVLNRVESTPGRDVAVVNFAGRVTGLAKVAANQQTLQGSYRFDLKAGRLTELKFEVTSIVLDGNQKKLGDTTASFHLTKEPVAQGGADPKELALDANEENTLLLVVEPRIGLEMVHSRRWVPRPVSDKQWMIDGPAGSGLTIQFEPSPNIPAAGAVRKEIETTLGKRAQGLKPEGDPPGWVHENRAVERLAWRGSQDGKEYVFEYFLWKQGQKGAIIAARYHALDALHAQKDVERMVRSLRLDAR